MGGKGQSGPVAGNDEIVQMQKQQAAQAKESNAERNARLSYGKDLITRLFEGRPSDAKKLDLSGIGKSTPAVAGTTTTRKLSPDDNSGKQYISTPNPNAGQRGQQNPSIEALNPNYNPTNAGAVNGVVTTTTGGTPASDGSSGTLADGYTWKALPDNGGNTAYGIFDSAGNMVNSANSLSELAASDMYYGGGGAGSTKVGGFGDDFYGNYRQSIMDYYRPQEGDQYNTARSSLAASLSRAGTSDSSIAAFDIAKLAKQDALNNAQIASQADTQTGSLRTQIAQDEQSALNQLYSTEDPSVAANTAGNMVANAALTKPLLNPAGALFAPITAGVGNALTGFLNPTAYINPNAGGASTATGQKDYGQTVAGY
jgi:hypothetical protein